MKSPLVTITLLFVSTIVFAQAENCEVTLTRATEEFQNGHFYSIPGILSECLDKFTPEQQQRANILLTQTYLLLDDPLGAKASYLRVLRANPEFVADENLHPTDVVYLSKKFTTAPIFAWFVKAGANVSPVRIIYDLDVFDDKATEQYKLKTGYQVAIGSDLYIDEKFGLRLEFDYIFSSYQHSTYNFFQNDSKQFFDNQTWLSVPLTLMYHGHLGKRFKPYGYAGFSGSYLVRDIAHGTIEKVRVAEGEKDDQTSPDWNFLYKRNQLNYNIIAGGGIKMKFGLQYLFLDARYSLGLKNVVNPKNLYVDNNLPLTDDKFIASYTPTASFAHVDDYFRLDNLSVSIGYLHPIYKPREIKTHRRSIFRKRKKPVNEAGQ
jgi:hypothetical protein